MNVRNPAVRFGLLPAGIALALAPAFASAQEAKGTTDLDRISVTGSRIRGASVETQQPILTMTRESLEKQGFSSVADVLNNLTSAGSPAISRSESLASGENVGGYYVDIRNLGAERTLVLMNGKRLGASTSGLQDLSQIPMSAVERIEILKDGASSIYGSDAIAGVVNVITRKNFDGGEANVYVGQYGKGDGDSETYSMTLGARGERGSLTLSAEYSKQDPVWAKDRWYSRDGSLGPNSTSADWSPISQNGSWCNPKLYDCSKSSAVWQTLNPGGNPKNPNDYHAITEDEFANSNEQMTLLTGVKRKSVYINGTYDFTDSISLNTDVLYNERQTFQQIAGYPYQSASKSINTPLSADSAFNPVGQDVSFRRRLWEVPRTTDSQLKTLRFAPTLTGFFELGGKTFDWDVGALWNRNESIKSNRGDMSLIGARQALGPSFIDAGGVARCGTAANPILGDCRPWNPLLPYGVEGQGSLANQELQDFLFPTFTTRGVTKTTSFTANLSGAIVTLPAGDLGFALGVEHRKEEGSYVPDAFAQSGQSTGLGQKPTRGQYDLNEVYLELNVPLLADMAFAKELTLNVASRYSDYSNFGGTTNSKFGLTWRPLDELLVRGTYAEGFRAPTISDLYGGLSSSFESYIDPCGVKAPGSVAGNAACSGAGVPANYVQLGQAGKECSTLPCQSGDQFISGANPNLKPETSKSTTFGLVWSPRWVQGLDVSLDWYKYEISDMIIADSVDRILRDCYVLGNASRCSSVTRAADGHVSAITYGTANLGKMETQGYDLGIKYRLPELAIGQFSIDWQTSYTAKYDEQRQNSAGDNIMVGRVSEPGLFRVRSNLGVNWQYGDFGVNYTARYYSGMKESCISLADGWCDAPNHMANGETDPLRHTGSNTFHDLQVSWKAPWDATIALGANNVFDHKGALQYSAPNSAFAYYGGFDVGRFLYMKYTQRF
ncbi:TonB-dependent receptor [Stenotrophomonas maltophilia]|jgi:iron complex outermembrane receptor protein|uniref:TonB-dependent receptor n=3 Tax=Gammaproteobacteria TaxID=1236 RepID=A0ABU5MH78_9GAMM|nr:MULTISPECIES: TonB-dependent receptor [Stenotrophomonas]AWB79803.1 TonB-dependent receptor [Stenotrophomonas maltophilia]KDE92087.1 TonB-dependent receptor [Stenotrophomonas maltophilia M30]CCH14022.1 TonB-dependent receptor [Stenotrophomonas maltophilia D457]KKF86532.1 TonB-dependent receptor [Stenotrophomonas maltophilia]KLN98959.1 TonB-dependent receptor [Stenotrophomonas maltophilia]